MKLVACMMVRDEEEQLPRCLKSIKKYVDSIIIVDTGSTDQTIEIAKSFGAEMHYSPWRNDFSYHRNESISYAPEDCWIIIIDADEEFVPEKGITKTKLKKWLSSVSPHAVGLLVRMTDIENDCLELMSCNSARLFRKGEIQYRNPVHNVPIFKEPGVFCPLFEIKHYGYHLAPEKMKVKFHRMETMLLKQLEERPENLQTAFYLCQLYGQFNDLEKCIKWGEQYLTYKDKLKGEFNSSINFSLIKSYHMANRMDEAYKLIHKCLKESPIDPDICFALSDHGLLTNNFPLMAEGSRRFIEGYQLLIDNPIGRGVRFHFTLRPDFLVTNLYRLFVATLEETKDTWDQLKPMIPYLDNGTQSELLNNLHKIGIKEFVVEYQDIIGEGV
jgi:glycosyltransferase involved in cell wall biosynthesis